MYLNHVALAHMTKMRMDADQRRAESAQYLNPTSARLNLMVWRERVRKVLEELEALRVDLDRKESSFSDSA